MKLKNNILLKTVEFLKENHLDVKDLNEEMVKNVIYSDNLSEQDDAEDRAERLYKQHAHDNEDYVDDSPFTPKEVSILKALHRNLSKDELQQLTTEAPENYAGGSGSKFWNVMKLFGIDYINDVAEATRVSLYAKWALDNWTEEGDYGNIETPVKVPLKWYNVDMSETGSQIEYKVGSAEVLGFDEDDAEERAQYDFYSWGGEMETNDWGDYESYDSTVDEINFNRLDESIRKILREQEEDIDNRTKALISIGGIQRDKVTTPKFIKNIFKSSGHEAKSSGMEPEDGEEWNTFYTPGTNIDLNSDVQRVRDRIRFEEYGEMFQQGIEGRGFAFEGMLAGLFNGEPMEAGGKEDIKIGSDYYSIKQSNPGDAWDTGSLQKGYQFATENMVRDGFSEEEIPSTPVELMVSGEDYIQYQAQMLTESFKASNGEPLKWIFAHVLDAKHIEYDVMDSDALISAILSSDCVGEVGKSPGTRSPACAVGISRKDKTGLRIKSRFVLGDPKMITFPTVSEEDIRSIIYDPEGDRVEDKIRRIFKDPNKVSQYTVDYIKNNPNEFLSAVNEILPTLTKEEKEIAYNLLKEDSDIFGQGLLDPIEPEEFEGDEEEWEKITTDIEDYTEPSLPDSEYTYTGGPTDPEKGFVAPSREVTDNICKVKGFCKAQGPITFGQLRELVEEATSKRIQADMGRGVFKTLWRIIPFFVPQILLAAVGITLTRAINKIVTPALKDTRGYKEWWGKVVLKAMDIAEGDYIPDIAMGDDPLSKVFFISDGLLQMIRDKYKLKFARYVADVAAAKPDNEPVPDWFVENLLRNYLNQKFLLDPPLPIKDNVEEEQIDESYLPLKPDEQKKRDLTPQIFQTLDHEFSIHPHPQGDIDNMGEPVALYSHSLDMFVHIDDIWQPIENMITGEIPQEDIEMFVGIITDWLNQRINLKTDTSLNEVDESKNPFGLIGDDWKDEILRHEEQLSANELKYKKLADELDRMVMTVPVNIDDGEEPVIGTTNITFQLIRPYIFQGLRGDFFDRELSDDGSPIVIRYDLVFRGVEPGSFLEELLGEEGGGLAGGYDGQEDDRERLIELLQNEMYDINESIMKKYFKLYGLTVGRLGTIYDSGTLKEQERDNWQEDKPMSKATHDDTKLNVLPATLHRYLDETHRERFLKEIKPLLHCLEYNCYDGWKDDPDNEWDEEEVDFDEQAQGYCNECGDELNNALEKLDQDLVKLGFAEEHDGDDIYTNKYRKTWLEKPFPYSYNVWVDGLVKEINPRFYVDSGDNISYVEDRMRNQPTLFEHKESKLNPELMVGDEILVVDNSGTPRVNLPELYLPYVVEFVHHPNKQNSYNYQLPNDAKPSYSLDLLDPPDLETAVAEGIRIKDLKLYPQHRWVFNPGFKRKETITEHQESKLNPELMIGDEILVVSTEGIHDFGEPELYEPYVVVGLKHGSTINREIHKWTHGEEDEEDRWDSPEVPRSRLGFRKEFDTIPYTYYQIEPIGMTDEERTGAMLAGGGRMKPMYIFPSPSEYRGSDQWILRPGFLRGEHLTERRKTITESLREALNDLTYRDEPREKHSRRMAKDLGDLRGFPLDKYRNMPPPENESTTTEEEIEYLETIPVDKNLVDSADEIGQHFKNFLEPKGLEYPSEELKVIMPGVKAIILRLKYHYNRPRPWQIAQAKGLELNSETLQSSSSPSYPSGHATQGRFVARYLADLYPEYRDEITQIGEDIAYSRNMAKVHYPSDSKFGKLLGDDMYNYVYKPQQEEVETELNEYCPMGNPNRCEIVDYDSLPDTLHETVMIDDSSHPYTEDQYIDFIEYAIDELEIEESPVIKIEREATGNYTTGSYNKKTGEIKIKGTKRQLADVLRSIAHEMVHHRQNELGLIVGKIPAVGGKIEDDANMYAGQLVKSYGQQLPEIYTENTVQKVFRRTINEALEPDWSIRRGRQHYAMNQPSDSGEPTSAFNDYLVKKSPFNYMGFDYYLSAVPGRMPETARIDIFVPMLDTGRNADKLWDGPDILWYETYEDEIYDPTYYEDPDENYRLEEAYRKIEKPPHQISYHERYGQHYAYDDFLDEHPGEDKHKEGDHVNEPGAAYAHSWDKRRGDLVRDIEEIQKLFGIENTIINRDVNRPWSRTPDSYGNEKIRPGKIVPRGKELETA